MSEMKFIVRGAVVPAYLVAAHADAPKPKPARDYLKRVHERDIAKESAGFLVSGFSPAQIAAAEIEHNKAQAEQAERIAKGGKLEGREKIIGNWSLDALMSKAKPKKVRSKPYEIEAAAEECAELARKAGWLRVTVEELMRG